MAGPIASIIKNDPSGNAFCTKFPLEDFNDGTQLIVSEFEEALFYKGGIIEEAFGAGTHTLSTNNYPFLTRLRSITTGGVSPYNCKVFYINKIQQLDMKWGTPNAIRIIDPYWGIEVNVKARGAYTAQVINGKQFFIKLIGNNIAIPQAQNRNSVVATQEDIVQKFRVAFLQDITDSLSEYLLTSTEEVLTVCSKKRMLADNLKEILNSTLQEYGMGLVNFYIESIEIPLGDPSLERIKEMRIQRQERKFEREQLTEDERLRYGLMHEESQAERKVAQEIASADYETMKIRDQDGNNGWARKEAAEIMKKVAVNPGTGDFANAGMGLGIGLGVGAAAGNAFGGIAAGTIGNQPNQISPLESTQEQGIVCDNCNTLNSFGKKFCGECGNPLLKPKIICPKCGAELEKTTKFCGECGTKI